jgi:hypothetical protein
LFKRTKEIGESSKTILQKKTNKSSNSRSSTTLNNPKQQRTTTNQDYHLSPNTNNQSLVSERPLRFYLLLDFIEIFILFFFKENVLFIY